MFWRRFWLSFGLHFGVIFGSFFGQILARFFMPSGGHFGRHFASLLGSFWGPKSIPTPIKILMRFRGAFGRAPGALQVEKTWFSLSKTEVFEDPPFRPRAP